jgi:Zn-dependent peptidase ImmA (M78 family)
VASVLAELRSLCPARALPAWDSRQVAERQAARLLRRHGITGPPVPEEVIADLPRIKVRYVRARNFAATARWSTKQRQWLILVNRDDTIGRQRFSVAHEYHHVVTHPYAATVYRDRAGSSAYLQAERAADAFAAALLMPKPWVKRAFYDQGIRDERVLARVFGVSVAAMRVRIDQLGLLEPEQVLT